jgi:hypothetical protein
MNTSCESSCNMRPGGGVVVGMLLLSLMTMFTGLAWAQTKPPAGPFVVWETGQPFSLQGISPHDPSVVRKGHAIPSGIPTTRDFRFDRRVLYFRLDSVTLLEDLSKSNLRSLTIPVDANLKERRTSMDDREWAVEDFRTITLRYMMYYRDDVGFNAHDHDLENILVAIEIDEDRDRRLSATIISAAGKAHGADAYSNELTIARAANAVFPIHFLVEEGKHAVSPDGDANGKYHPGIDVNVSVRDAWGIRDQIASGRPQLTFVPDRNRTRHPRDQVWPARYPDRENYALVHSLSSDFCMTLTQNGPASLHKTIENADALFRMTDKHAFCDSTTPILRPRADGLDTVLVDPLSRESSSRFGSRLSAFSYRYDLGERRGFHIAWAPLATEKNGYWLATRLNLAVENPFRRGISEEFLVVRTASGALEPYGILGIWQGLVDTPIENSTSTTSEVTKRLVTEAGLKLRFRTERTPFLGIKFGARWVNLRDRSFVVEVGPAPF